MDSATTNGAIWAARRWLADAGIALPPNTPNEDAMPRYAARRDTNHAEIRDGLRQCGFSVFDAGGVGGDFPDLVVGVHGTHTFLVEIKGPRGKLSAGQRAFRDDWKGGPVITAHSLDEVLLAIIRLTRKGKPYGVAAGGDV